MTARHVIVAVHDLGGDSSVARVARRQVEHFRPEFRVDFISNSRSDALDPQHRQILVRPHEFHWLRRFGHVPREVAFALCIDRALGDLARTGHFVDWVITHSHVVAALVARTVHNRLHASLAICVHGDVFDRPPEMYGRQLLALYRWAAKWSYPQCDRVYALSRHGSNLARAAGARAEAIRVLPNGVDVADLGIPALPQGMNSTGVSKAIRLLFVGRLSSEKGLDVLLEACSLLSAGGRPWSLTVVGDGPEKYALLMQSIRLGISDQVHFVGPLPRGQLGRMYSSHDLVCMPSRSDPFPLVALEAMGSGTALVAAPVGGLQDLLEDGSGILVPRNDAGCWADEISKLHSDRERLLKLAKKGQEKVLAEHSWPVVSLRLKRDLQGSSQTRAGSTVVA